MSLTNFPISFYHYKKEIISVAFFIINYRQVKINVYLYEYENAKRHWKKVFAEASHR